MPSIVKTGVIRPPTSYPVIPLTWEDYNIKEETPRDRKNIDTPMVLSMVLSTYLLAGNAVR